MIDWADHGDVEIVFDDVQCHTESHPGPDELLLTSHSMYFDVNGTTTLKMRGINSITTEQSGTAALGQRGSGPITITSDEPSTPGSLTLSAGSGISTGGSLTVDSVGFAVTATRGPAVASHPLTLQYASASLAGTEPMGGPTRITGGSVHMQPASKAVNAQGVELTHYVMSPTEPTDLLYIDDTTPWTRPRIQEVHNSNPLWDVWLTAGQHVISTPDHSQCWLANEGSVEEKNCVDVVEGLVPVISQATVGPTWVTVTADPSTDGRLAEFSIDGTHWVTTDESTHQATLKGLTPGTATTVQTRFAADDSGTLVPIGQASYELPGRVSVGGVLSTNGSNPQSATVGTKLAELANTAEGWSFTGPADTAVDVVVGEPTRYRFKKPYIHAVTQ